MEPLTPSLWLGTPLVAQPKISKVLDKNNKHVGVIVNAYDILVNFKNKRKTIEKDGIHSFLDINKPVLLDSGGFIFQKKAEVKIKIDDLVKLYNKSKPDIAVALDFPINPMLPTKEDYKRTTKTRNLLKELLVRNPEPEIMPVVHGYSLLQLRNNLNKTLEIYKDYTNKYPKWLGIGSLVPLFRNIKGTGTIPRNKRGFYKEFEPTPSKFALVAIQLVKRAISKYNIKLHAFGVGGATTMKLVYASGADSVDSVGWRLKAAHGAIQFIGLSDRFLFPRKDPKRKVLEKKLEPQLTNCKCPVAPHSREDLEKSFVKRAIHNAYVYQDTLKWISEKKDDNYNREFFKDLKKLMSYSSMKRFISFTEELNNGGIEKIIKPNFIRLIKK